MHYRFAKTVVSSSIIVLLIAISLSTALSFSLRSGSVHADAMQTYVVLYKAQSVPSDASSTIAQAGGQLIYSYPQIGVAIARSDNAMFSSNLLADNQIDGASATTNFASQVNDDTLNDNSTDDTIASAQNTSANTPGTDTFASLQWDMDQIHTSEAHAITSGSRSVLVGDIDTGLDYKHPDLRQNVDDANSVNCVGGVPIPGMVAANDDNGHGTHTAGTIAAASNGIGIVGVAPNVRIAAIKAGNAAGFFFPEAVICAFIWAGTHHMDVTNNSYFADPFLYNCRNDATQRAIWKAEQRAILFAEQQGVTVVAAAGNERDDLSHPVVDNTSPDNSPPISREVTNACVVIPVEVPGVIGVSADGNLHQDASAQNPNGSGFLKSFYSSYGTSAVGVVAPGGDSVFGRTAQAVNGTVLSTWPPNIRCGRNVKETGDAQEPAAVYCFLQGTSMATPHVAGVAALIISQYGSLKSGKVSSHIQQTADTQPCPTSLPAGYAAFTTPAKELQVCQGGTGHNSWYGNGQVNALSAVTHNPGQ